MDSTPLYLLTPYGLGKVCIFEAIVIILLDIQNTALTTNKDLQLELSQNYIKRTFS